MPKENINKAYSEGLKLKNSSYDEEAIYIKLTKQGFSEALSKQVAQDVTIERDKSVNSNKRVFFILGIAAMALGTILFIVTLIFAPGWFILPGGFIMSGALTAALNVSQK